VRFLSNHGGDYTTAAEVRVLEAGDGAASILRDIPKNLALPSLGGAVVRFTSAAPDTKVGQLVDDGPASEGWRSADGYLPQEFIFAFPGDRVALIDHIVLHPTSSHDPTTWPRRITVSASAASPLDGFEEAGQFTLRQEPHEQAFPIGRRARFLRLRILENFGGPYTSLGKIKVIEGAAAEYQSVLREPYASVIPHESMGVSPGTALSRLTGEPGVVVEREPNGTPAEAHPLEIGRTTRGAIDPPGDEDYFKLSASDSATSVLTLELLGRPNIRTSVTLFDAAGAHLKRFDPGTVPAQQARFSWAVGPGEYLLQVTEPFISMSIVLIWDTSGSMKGRTEDLRRAVEVYLDQVRPSERLNLIRFSNPFIPIKPGVEVRLPEFTSDRERLKAATAGQFFSDGDTPLYDAIGKGIELLEGVEGNRAIVVMTDGADTASRLDHSGFWRLLQDKRIRLYTIGLGYELHTYLPAIASTGERILAHAALATNGRFFFARAAEELQGIYQQVADELRAVSSYDVRPTLSRGPGHLSVVATGERIAAVAAPPQIEFILDASGSMKETLKGRRKIDIAKETMMQIIEGLPDDLQVALRVYGHRIREGRPGDCQDSELVVPFTTLDKPRLRKQVRAMRALGTTPIAYSLQQVEHDFGAAPGEKIVVLVTDGKEECQGHPSAVVSELLTKGLQVRLHVVGFALGNDAARREMQQLAERTGGRFFNAKDAKTLHGAIEQALAVPYDMLDAASSSVASGFTGRMSTAVPEGVYTLVVRAAGQPITIADVRVAHDQFTRVELKKEGQEVGTRVLGPVQKKGAPWAVDAAAPPSPRDR
jgi:Mg-chelatase subunit ChlD